VKRKKLIVALLIVTVLANIVGAILNCIVVCANRGMPTIAYAQAVGKWVSLTPETRFSYLSDIIRVGSYVISIGDLFIIIAMVVNLVTVWMAIPRVENSFHSCSSA